MVTLVTAVAVVVSVSTFFFDVLELPVLLGAELAEPETLLTGLEAAKAACVAYAALSLTINGRLSRPVAPFRGFVGHCKCLGGL